MEEDERFRLSLTASLLMLAFVLADYGSRPLPPERSIPRAAELPPQAAVSIGRMKPGDPVLSVRAPAGTTAVIAEFSFGKRRLCRRDASGPWLCRFVVPRGTPDGRYSVRVTAVGAGGTRARALARYTVDTKAPVLVLEARREAGRVVVRARPKFNVLESSVDRKGVAQMTHDVKRLTVLSGDRQVIMRLERRVRNEFVWSARIPAARSVAVIEAVDYAGNARRENVALP